MILATTYTPGADEKIAYDDIFTNVGGGYSTQRNEFVCAEPGVYVFYANVWPLSGTACHLYIAKNGIEITRVYGNHNAPSTGSNMAVLELEQGDTVSVHRGSEACILEGDEPYNAFSGFKLN